MEAEVKKYTEQLSEEVDYAQADAMRAVDAQVAQKEADLR